MNKYQCLLKAEELMPLEESLRAVGTELQEALGGLLWGKDALGMTLGEELVGIADKLFLERLGQVVGKGERQLALLYLLTGDTCAGMAFTDSGMTGITFLTKHSATYHAVTQVWCVALTMDARSIAPADADIVEHGGLFDKLTVYAQLGMAVADLQAHIGHLTAMVKQETAKVVVLGVIFLYDCVVIHIDFYVWSERGVKGE